MLRREWASLCVLGLGAAALGCGHDAGAARYASERAKYLLSEEPSGALPVIDAREELECDGMVTLVGQIGGAAKVWTQGKASFLLADPSLLAADDPHDHACGDNCPYCKKKQEEQALGLALVEIVDDAGQVVPVDARQLLGLAEEQTVVVRGQATVDNLGNLIVRAGGLYIRR